MALQYGVPLEVLVSKFSHVRFEPSGFTKNPDIPMAKSLIDYVFRFMGSRFLGAEQKAAVGLVDRDEGGRGGEPQGQAAAVDTTLRPPIGFAAPTSGPLTPIAFSPQADAPSCPDCGSIMVRNGACYKCLNCGATSGCS
jgi:ribonucleoside-diphosphate reductase alpha chain